MLATEPAREPPGLTIEYEAAAGCPSAEAFQREVEARAKGRNLRAVVRVRIDAANAGRVEVGESGTRSVTGASCDEVVGALALATAMMLEPLPEAATVEAPARSEALVSTDASRPPVPRAPEHAPELQPGIGAYGGIASGIGPSVAPRLGLFVDARWHGLSAGLGFDYAWAPTVSFGTGTIDFTRATAVLDLCPLRLESERLALETCVTGAIGALSVVARDVESPESVRNLWLSAGPLLRTGVRITSRFELRFDLNANLAIARNRYYFRPDTLVYETPLGSLSGALGLRASFL
jgi:hypothetical protein